MNKAHNCLRNPGLESEYLLIDNVTDMARALHLHPIVTHCRGNLVGIYRDVSTCQWDLRKNQRDLNLLPDRGPKGAPLTCCINICDYIPREVNTIMSCLKRIYLLEEESYNSAQPFTHASYQRLILKEE